MASTTVLPAPPPLSAFARPALFLDFDGTLVDIAPTPDGIEVPPHLAERLHGLAARLSGRLALVSGRSLDDIERHLGPLELYRAGSHGLDCRREDGSSLGEVPVALPLAATNRLERFARENDLDFEAKAHGGALHFRARPELREGAERIASELAAEHGLAVKHGKCVAELVARGSEKGAAVRAIMGEPAFTGSEPIFVGDDVTDADGMTAAKALGGFGVIVGDRHEAAATYRVPTVEKVRKWLSL